MIGVDVIDHRRGRDRIDARHRMRHSARAGVGDDVVA